MSMLILKMIVLNSLCVLSSLFVVSANNIPQFILQVGASGHCGQSISIDQSVILKSHAEAGARSSVGGLESYTAYAANQNCEITYDARSSEQAGLHQVLFQFMFIDLQPPVWSNCPDYVQLTGISIVDVNTISKVTTATTSLPTTSENTTEASSSTTFSTSGTPPGYNATLWNSTEVCNYTQVNQTFNETSCWFEWRSYVVWISGTSTPSTTSSLTTPLPAGTVNVCQYPDTFYSNGSMGTVRFVSDASLQRGGFILLLTRFHTGPCTASEFLCDTNRCISTSLLCDSITHCIDGADESTQQAKCPDFALSTEGMSPGAIIGLVVVVIALITASVIAVIMLWKYYQHSGGQWPWQGEVTGDSLWRRCPCRGGETDSDLPRQQLTKSSKGPGKTKVTPTVTDGSDV